MRYQQWWELRRKLVHLSGVLWLGLAQFVGPLAGLVFLLVSLAFFSYGQLVQRTEQSHHTPLRRFEARLRDLVLRFEHERKAPLLFQGLIWYYFSSGLVLLLFPWEPLNIATAACLFLAIGDGFSTLVGVHGSNRLAGKKTYEGTLAFLGTSFLAGMLLLPPWLPRLGALAAAPVELVPAPHTPAKPWSKLWDDNLLIPFVSGAVMWAAASAAGLV